MDDKLRAAIAEELQIAPSEFTADRELRSFEQWDSTIALTIMIILGDALGVPIEPNEMARLKTVGDMEALVASKGAASRA